MKWMNLNHLRYFLTIAEEGSLSAASKKILVGQPALSVQLKQFEKWLNLKLFDRVGKRMTLTQSGEYVLKYARGIRALEEELLANIGHAQDGVKKEYVIGAQESVPKSILAQAISAVNDIDNVKLKIIEGKGDELFQLLVANKIDFFIGNVRPTFEDKELVYLSLGKEEVSVWGSKTFLNLKKNFPKSIEDKPFILPGFQNQLRHDFERFMLKSGIHFEVTIEAQDTALQKALASRSEGLVVLGDESARSWSTIGSQLHQIGKLPGIKEEYWLGMVKKRIDNELVKKIVKSFK